MSDITEARSIAVMSEAAKTFGSPSATACQLTIERQENAAQSISVVNSAAPKANTRPPLSIQKPHRTLSMPNVDPDMSAVFAAAGFER